MVPKSPVARKLLQSYKKNQNRIVVSGPRNCAKTVLILWYLFNRHSCIPNLKSCIFRFERNTIKSTILPSIREDILRYPLADPRNPFEVYGGENSPEHIRFNNGGQMDFRGLDVKGKVLGSAYDLVFINQVEHETRAGVWGDIIGAMAGGRAGNWRGPNGERYWQLIADANPSTPYHFLYQRKDDDDITWLDFTHKENPLMYNWNTNKWTKHGIKTIEDLKKDFKGFHYARMVEGKWVAAEGVVYPHFNDKIHIQPLKRSDFGSDTEWCASIDWGGRAITAIGIYAIRDNTYYLFKEICKTQTRVSDVLNLITETQQKYDIPNFKAVYVDHDAEHVLQCEDFGLHIVLADKGRNSVVEGIETVSKIIGDNRLIINTTSIDERDTNAADLPQGFAEEVKSYAYPPPSTQADTKTNDHPIKKDDHSCDQVRYILHTREGMKKQFELPPSRLLG